MPQVLHKITDCVKNDAPIQAAAACLRRGELVVFPTETVYGLGANALDPSAVEKIFALKGRPACNPLIVHLAEPAQARRWVREWPQSAEALAAAFWPGPLTLVLPKTDDIPPQVTAGGPTVALRVPAHPVALALLRAAQVPVAAPSANRSGEISPTRAEHVLRSLGERIVEVAMILDAGPTQVGLESTVVSLVGEPRLLRPGQLSVQQIEAVLGRPLEPPDDVAESVSLPSPGLLRRHYSPRTRMELVNAADPAELADRAAKGERLGLLTQSDAPVPSAVMVQRMPGSAVAYAARLYDVLHTLDTLGLDRIIVDLPPTGSDWQAIHDRLARAAAQD